MGVTRHAARATSVLLFLMAASAYASEYQTITFDPLAPVAYGDADFYLDPGATASSSLPVTYVSSNGNVATITTDGYVQILGVGTTAITASQGGDENFNQAADVSQTLTVTPAAPNITGPVGIQDNTYNVWLTWEAPPGGADSYYVAVYDYYNATVVLPGTSTGANTFHLTGLTDNHGYIVSVQAISNVAGTGPWSWEYVEVSSYGQAPGVATITTGANHVFAYPGPNGSIELTWGRVAGTGRYDLYVTDWLTQEVLHLIIPDPGTDGTVSASVAGLLNEHVYLACLTAQNPYGTSYCNYEFGVSTASGAPAAPDFTLPPVQTLSYSSIPYYTPRIATSYPDLVFEWSKTAHTLGYNFMLVEVDPDYSFLGQWWITDDGTGNPVDFDLPSGITLKDGCKYEMWADGYNPWGLGPWTVVDFVPGDAPPTTAVLCTTASAGGTTPTGQNDSYDKRPTLSCPSVARATQYFWYIDELNGTWNQKEVIETLAVAGAQQSHILSWAEALTPGLVYAVRVRAHNLLGDTDQSNDAVYWQVTPVPAQTTWAAPIGALTNTPGSTTLAWANQEHVLTWNLSLVDTTAGVSVHSGPITVTIDQQHDWATATLALQNGHSYEASVRGENNSGSAAWSVASDFSVNSLTGVPGRPWVTSPIGDVGTTTPPIQWLSVTGAGWYYVVVQDNSAQGQPYVILQGVVETDGGPTQLACGTGNYSSALVQGHSYGLQVYASNGFGWSVGSLLVNFTVGPPQTAPTMISPLQNGTNIALWPAFSWTYVPGADYYWLIVADGSTSPPVFDGEVDSTWASPVVLSAGHSYLARVSACNGFGVGPESWPADAFTVGTAPSPPSDLAATVVSSTEIDLSWTDNSNNEAGFTIWRGTYDGSPEVLLTVGSGVTTYQDTGLAAGTDYYYYVMATNDWGSTDWSNESDARTSFSGAPTGVPNILGFIFPSYSTRPTITWTDVAGATFYVLHITDLSTQTSQDYQVPAGDPGLQTFALPAVLAANNSYSVTVAAGNQSGYGGWGPAQMGSTGGGGGGNSQEDVAWSPQYPTFRSWEPFYWCFGGGSAKAIIDHITNGQQGNQNQGSSFVRYIDSSGGVNPEGCTVQHFQTFANETGIAEWSAHGNTNNIQAFSVQEPATRDPTLGFSAYHWRISLSDSLDTDVVLEEETSWLGLTSYWWGVRVFTPWLSRHWAPSFAANKAIVVGDSCSSLPCVAACTPRTGFGYETPIGSGYDAANNNLLFRRLNGTNPKPPDGTLRRAGEGYNAGGFWSSFSMCGNYNTTLCPSVEHPLQNDADKGGADNVKPLGSTAQEGDGCVILDTHCDMEYFGSALTWEVTDATLGGSCEISNITRLWQIVRRRL